MPIYEYRCQQGHTFEVMQRMSDDPVEICETCEAPVSRVFHPIAVHFKGSGFYNTDYGTRKRQRENAAHAESSSTKDSSAKDSGSGDSSPKDSSSKDSSKGGSSSAGESSSPASSGSAKGDGASKGDSGKGKTAAAAKGG
jgi:putative FmdB family regulatory protein